MSINQFPGGIVTKTPAAPTTSSAKGIWTLSQATGYAKQGIWPRVPGAPTIGTATAGAAVCASVTFTAPTCVGAGSLTYSVVSTPGCISNTGASSPIVVSGLTGGTSYTFKVYGVTPGGTGPESAASNSITAVVPSGSQSYTTAGTYSWVAPAGVTSVSVVAIGAGAGGYGSTSGAGGELRYINNTTVTPGNSYTVIVGARGNHNLSGNNDHGKPSSFSSVIQANGGGVQNNWPCCSNIRNWERTSGFGGTGFLGGAGRSLVGSAGGGGAGGYSGQGGTGGTQSANGTAGAGGGGGGGAGNFPYSCCGSFRGGGGGGTGILGSGSNGSGGTYTSATKTATGGGAGSGGTAGVSGGSGGCGGAYGGGGSSSGNGNIAGFGAQGAVRIIWPGTTRSFPSTNTSSP